jgi:hypothetical protein
MTRERVAHAHGPPSSGGAALPTERLVNVLELIAGGYVEAGETAGRHYALTAEGQSVLDERGVGANES